MSSQITAPQVRSMKGDSRIVCLTAYDYTSGRIADRAGVDVILVGDSVGNVVLGYESTIPVTLEEMEHHVRATSRAVERALLVADMPLGSYGSSVSQAVDSAVRLVKAGANAVKLEGDYCDEVRAIQKTGIPVMGHVGFTPQSVHNFGGYKVQGRKNKSEVIRMAKSLDDAGVFAMVLELIPAELSAEITKSVSAPTIGIGAGIDCDGEIQVFHDIMGLAEKTYKHTRVFAHTGKAMIRGARQYAQAVRERSFPTEENSF
ncbi:3-methyl-2-oxobutanoate hydroxymethyltransferase [Kamptonema cortianum]|nr:3-methyl-2-oxobutanoate hydroxymethyltransferase [Geitlerinema splendidum]MDK3155922.1 3-methyl-2-oxobutanoate hydroxymethyltransferase [Kamptonema cortianum]